MLTFVEKYRSNVFSQNGEDFIIAEVMRRLKITKGRAVEFGACDGLYCSNTANLKGWKRILIEPGGKLPIIDAFITPENVNDYVPNCDLLSIDVDGNDFNIWKAYTGKAKMVIIEINSSIEFWRGDVISDPNHGTGYKPMVELGLSKGYFLLGHSGNLLWLLNEYRPLFPEITGDPLIDIDLYFDKKWMV